MSATQQLKQAFIKQAHEQDKMITFAIFVKELAEDLELAQWIYSEFGHCFEAAAQMHMRNMLEAQLKLNAGHDYVITQLLTHIERLAEQDSNAVNNSAQQATKDLLSKFKLH